MSEKGVSEETLRVREGNGEKVCTRTEVWESDSELDIGVYVSQPQSRTDNVTMFSS